VKTVLISGAFDNIRSLDLRFLQEASRFGRVILFLWKDDVIQRLTGKSPDFPLNERLYFLESTKYVDKVVVSQDCFLTDLELDQFQNSQTILVESDFSENPEIRKICLRRGIDHRMIPSEELDGFPDPQYYEEATIQDKRRVIVTGCYDWFHSGHIRFFEEVSGLGELHVVVGHDQNIRLLKGEGHPMYRQEERRFMAASIRFVKKAYVSSGNGWLDAEPEIEIIRPHIYAVNEDGDRLEKKEFCEAHGIEYHVLKRLPKEGLPRRQSTDLRGF
jgi:cytidyltransferase-like protein